MPILAMRCQVVSLQEKPWCTSFRRQVNKHSEEEAKFIWLTFGICKVGLKFLEYETFESWTLCHLQEFARGALKQCREIRASSLPFLSTPSSRSAAALADPLWGAAWSRPLPGPWLLEGGQQLQDCKDCHDSTHQVICIVPYKCQEWV